MGKKDKQRHLDDGGAGGEKPSKKQKRAVEEQPPAVGKASAAQAAPTVRDNLPVTRMTQYVLRRPCSGADYALVVSLSQTPAEAFAANVKEHAAYFDRLVALIPAKFYLPPTEEQEEGQQNVRETAQLCGGHSAF
jgi:hypothetical protein